MKKVLVFGLTLAALSFASPAIANTPDVPDDASHKLPPSVIDGIEVPFGVLDYAQMKYQGHAVTQVTRSHRGGQSAYQLRVDNDDILYDDDCIFLWYDMNWKLMGEGRASAQPAPSYAPFESLENEPPEPEQPEQPQIYRPTERPTRPTRPQEPDDEPEEEIDDEDIIEIPRGRGRRNR